MEQKVVKLEIGKLFAILIAVITIAVLAVIVLQGSYFKGDLSERVSYDTLESREVATDQKIELMDTKDGDYITSTLSDSDVATDGSDTLIETLSDADAIETDNYITTNDYDIITTDNYAVATDEHAAATDWSKVIASNEKAVEVLTKAGTNFVTATHMLKNDLILKEVKVTYAAAAQFQTELLNAKQEVAIPQFTKVMIEYENNIEKGMSHYDAVKAIMALTARDLGIESAEIEKGLEILKSDIEKGVDIELMNFEKGVNSEWEILAKSMDNLMMDWSEGQAAIEVMREGAGNIILGYIDSDYVGAIVINTNLPLNTDMANFFMDFGIVELPAYQDLIKIDPIEIPQF